MSDSPTGCDDDQIYGGFTAEQVRVAAEALGVKVVMSAIARELLVNDRARLRGWLRAISLADSAEGRMALDALAGRPAPALSFRSL
jgi:hypothetical protein